MTLTQLKYVVAVDANRHFATAADKCYVTQPTLSMQINKLEQELGVLIFDRSKHPVVPTKVGKEVVEQAKILLNQAEKLKDMATKKDDELNGLFRVGVIPTIAPYLIPLFLHKFNTEYPDVDLIFEEAITSELINKLNNDEIDVAIIATPVKQNSIHEHDLYFEPFVGYLSHKHELSNKKHLSLDDLDIEDIWLLNDGHCFRDQTVQLCKKTRKKKNDRSIQFESGNLETLKKLVEQDYGMTLLPSLAVDQLPKDQENIVTINFENPVPKRKVRLAYSRMYLKQSLIEALIKEILDNIPEKMKTDVSSIIVE